MAHLIPDGRGGLKINPNVKGIIENTMITPEQLAASGTEHGHQAAVFCYFNIHKEQYPLTEWMFAVPNGFFGSSGQKGKMKAEGLKNGVPDIFLPVPIWVPNSYRSLGLFIELKVISKKRVNDPLAGCSDDQKKWIAFLLKQHFTVSVCYGWEEARDRIISYLQQGKF